MLLNLVVYIQISLFVNYFYTLNCTVLFCKCVYSYFVVFIKLFWQRSVKYKYAATHSVCNALFYVVFTGLTSTEHHISFLPPLVLSFELPADYPSASAPVFTLSSKWLTRVQVSPVLKAVGCDSLLSF